MDDTVLQAMITLLVTENPPEKAGEALRLLKKIVDNAAQFDEDKYRRLPAHNKTVREKVAGVAGGAEVLDVVGYAPEAGSGDWVLRDRNVDSLLLASALITSALDDLPAVAAPASASAASAPAKASSTSTSSPSPSKTTSTPENDEYEARRRAAEERQKALKKKAEEDRLQREAVARAIKAEQKEVKDRPVTASHRVDYPRAGGGGGGGEMGNLGGSIPYLASDRELDALVGKQHAVLVNFTGEFFLF